jgi:hypothetical protein
MDPGIGGLYDSEWSDFRKAVCSAEATTPCGAPLVYIHEDGSNDEDLVAALEAGDRVIVLRAKEPTEDEPQAYHQHAMRKVGQYVKRHKKGRLAMEEKGSRTCTRAIAHNEDDSGYDEYSFQQPEGYRENGLCVAFPECGHGVDKAFHTQCKDVVLGDYFIEEVLHNVACGSGTLMSYYDPIDGKNVRKPGSFSSGPTLWSSPFTPTHMDYGTDEYLGAVGCITGHALHQPIKQVCWCSSSCVTLLCCWNKNLKCHAC